MKGDQNCDSVGCYQVSASSGQPEEVMVGLQKRKRSVFRHRNGFTNNRTIA
jgi:hypothetical protein